MKPRLLDLFCGAGGAAMGYSRAGFEVVGVDINYFKRYPFEFHRADALEYPLDGFDAIHASPPCQKWSLASMAHPDKVHVDCLAPIRKRLKKTSTPWVIENVPGAPLRWDIILCGSMFDLGVRRHRDFEIGNWTLTEQPPDCNHKALKAKGGAIGVYGSTGVSFRTRLDTSRGTNHGGFVSDWREAMGIDWMIGKEIGQAIPPAYTKWIGSQMMKEIA